MFPFAFWTANVTHPDALLICSSEVNVSFEMLLFRCFYQDVAIKDSQYQQNVVLSTQMRMGSLLGLVPPKVSPLESFLQSSLLQHHCYYICICVMLWLILHFLMSSQEFFPRHLHLWLAHWDSQSACRFLRQYACLKRNAFSLFKKLNFEPKFFLCHFNTRYEAIWKFR